MQVYYAYEQTKRETFLAPYACHTEMVQLVDFNGVFNDLCQDFNQSRPQS